MPHDSEGGITMIEQQILASYEAEQAVVGALIIGGNVDELTTEVNLTPNEIGVQMHFVPKRQKR